MKKKIKKNIDIQNYMYLYLDACFCKFHSWLPFALLQFILSSICRIFFSLDDNICS